MTNSVERWSYFDPQFRWSLYVLESDAMIHKIARALVIPFIFITFLEFFATIAQWSANIVILSANNINYLLAPKEE